MHLNGFVSKRKFAFLATFEAIWESAPHSYFWTFTPIEVMSDRDFADSWNRFNRRWGNHGRGNEFKGLRVFEPFQSGFLHCHVVINQRVSVDLLRELAAGTGIGRMHVRKAWSHDGEYLCKYMSKGHWKLPNGLRVWAKLGRWKHTAIRDVEVVSDATAIFRYCYHVLTAEITPQSRRYMVARALAQNSYMKLLHGDDEEARTLAY